MILCLLSILFSQAITATRPPHLNEDGTHVPYKYVWDKLNPGREWKVYIQVMTYDLLVSTFSGAELSNYRTLQTVRDVARGLPLTAIKKHPCRKHIFAGFGRQFEGKLFVQQTTSSRHFVDAVLRICGICSITFNPGHFIDEPNLDLNDGSIFPLRGDLTYVWHLQAGPGYAVNFTVSEFTAPPSHSCDDARVTGTIFYLNDRAHHIFCPNWGKQNLFAIHMKMDLLLRYYQKSLFTMDQQFTKLSAHYHIVDISQRFPKLYMFPKSQRAELGKAYTLSADNFTETFLRDPTVMHVLKSPTALVYLLYLCLDDYLTPVIFPHNVSCNISDGETIFYDGPIQLVWSAAVPVLKYWKCSDTSDRAADNNSLGTVRGSMGELTIICLMTRADYLHLSITWHAERILSNVLRSRPIVLNLSTVTTIIFHPTRSTVLEIVNVLAPQGKFVHLGFSEINYVLHTEILSNTYLHPCLDGLEIEDPMQLSLPQQICSNSTAEILLKHYQLDGLTGGPNITLKKKQYAWLGTISGVITASVHCCAGYINVFPTMLSTYKKPGATVTFEARYTRFANGSFMKYDDMRVVFKRASKGCCKLQIVPFRHLVSYIVGMRKMEHLFLKYMITSEDLTSLAHFIIDLSSIGGTLQFQNTSTSYALRLYSLNTRIVKPTVTHSEIWDTEAFSAQIVFLPSLLPRAAGFKLQFEDGTKTPVCTDERGANLIQLLFDMNLLGPCGKAQFRTYELDIVQIYKIHENRRCCHFDGYINIDHSIHGMIMMDLYSPGERFEPWIANLWDLSGNDTKSVIKFHVPCKAPCSKLIFYMKWVRNFLSTVSIVYQANLLGLTNIKGVRFRQPKIDLASPWPRLIAWNHVCHNDNCYSTPRSYKAATWDDAQKACEEQQASLVSINSDWEWSLLTRIPQQEGEKFIDLYNISDFILFYIGLITDVSKMLNMSGLRASNYFQVGAEISVTKAFIVIIIHNIGFICTGMHLIMDASKAKCKRCWRAMLTLILITSISTVYL